MVDSVNDNSYNVIITDNGNSTERKLKERGDGENKEE